jgi:hypothetical protein
MDRDLLTLLNEYGYAFLAKLLHERGAELGYWRNAQGNQER